MFNVPEMFGCQVFNDSVMKEKLPKNTYRALKATVKMGKPLDLSLANEIAHAMKDWALSKGVTHYTHWFQPMTGITAEKHDSFIDPIGDGSSVIMAFSGKNLIKGEPDASSFPSGGLRATFEARGYTAWDPTSYAFIKEGVLCIPTAFCSYGGEALDKKTPLLRSMEVINEQALRILKLFGSDATKVNCTIGPEQEYFLINQEVMDQRKDLQFCGRTLFGAASPKGQELDDHYFGAIKPRVAAYMDELDEELWKLGILAKTKHNEVAPSQHELAPIFNSANVATDHNQLTMELMQKIAKRHGLACLLHEKPFAGINGSGKHDNWSISTDTGINLLEPGKSPRDNAQFLLFLAAIIKAVDEYQDVLRLSVASAGNDHRLGANEAPPAIISIFLGAELDAVMKAIESGEDYHEKFASKMEIGVDVLPTIPKDTTDRNRTSPFAFTGNKFEFRMLGSTASISGPNIVLNTIVANALDEFATELEAAEDFTAALNKLMQKTIKKHNRIIFNGDGYADAWQEEAAKRGLLNLKTTVDALPHFIADKNIAVFTKYNVFTEAEMHSRYEILMEGYCKVLTIEAKTMLEMVKRDYLPSICGYVAELTSAANNKKALCADLDCTAEMEVIKTLSALSAEVYTATAALEAALAATPEDDITAEGNYINDVIKPAMDALRAPVDMAETMTASEYWPVPAYSEILFSV